jgi:hypothetical protein
MMLRRGKVRILTIVMVVIMGVLLIAGCTPATGGNSSPNSCAECQQLLSLYPWLREIGLGLLWSLVQQYGPDILAILVGAAASLAG